MDKTNIYIDKALRATPFIVAALLIATVSAYASGGGEAAAGEHGASPWIGFMWQVVNFSILVAILIFVARKPISEGLKSRIDTINKGIEEARAARQAAEKALAEVEERLKSKDREVQQMIEAAVRSGEKEKLLLIEDGKKMSQRIVEQAKVGIDLELKQARQALKKEAVEYAMQLAEQKIGQKISADDQKKLFEDALKRLEDRS